MLIEFHRHKKGKRAAKRIFGNSKTLTQTEKDAICILETMHDKKIEEITVRQLGKMILVHQKDRRKQAIAWLEQTGKIKIKSDGNKNVIIFSTKVKNKSADFCQSDDTSAQSLSI